MIATTNRVEMKPGYYPGLPFSDYVKIDAANSSTLKRLDRSARHALAAIEGMDDDTKSKRLGRCVHLRLLEPLLFDQQVVVRPEFKGKGSRAEKAEWDTAHAHCEIVTEREMADIVGMAEGVERNDTALEILYGKGPNEMSIVWPDPSTGELCKARYDMARPMLIADVKTTTDASPQGFSRQVANYGYAHSAGMYLEGSEVLDTLIGGLANPIRRRFLLLAVENSHPYECCVHELPESWLDSGRAWFRQAIRRYSECRSRKAWPGYPSGVNVLEQPKWDACYDGGDESDDTANNEDADE